MQPINSPTVRLIKSYTVGFTMHWAAGNPEEYLNGMKFTWSRGRQLSKITLGSDTKNDKSDDKIVEYTYNESGLRTSKTVTDKSGTEDVVTEATTYEWNESTLIRENVTDGVIGKTYDIWYFYDNASNVIGYEYSYVNDQNEKVSTRIYYEKDLQGNVNGLLNEEGKEIATYSYDAWGNITVTTYVTGYEIAYSLNHMTYRGYYRDNETEFYYLQSRYYDAEICRFVNADDVSYLGASDTVWKNNLYVYCNDNPVNYIDPDGNLIVYNPKTPIKVIKKCVWLAAKVYLSSKGYDLSKKMFYHSLYGKGKSLSKSNQKLLNKKMKNNVSLQLYICGLLRNYQNTKKTDIYITIKSFEFKSDKDLYFSAQHVKVFFHAHRMSGDNWKVNVTISDVYDFTEQRKWSSFANIANNVGYYLQKSGELIPYDWKSNFSITLNSTMTIA